jgi:hypothetical protein
LGDKYLEQKKIGPHRVGKSTPGLPPQRLKGYLTAASDLVESMTGSSGSGSEKRAKPNLLLMSDDSSVWRLFIEDDTSANFEILSTGSIGSGTLEESRAVMDDEDVKGFVGSSFSFIQINY